MTCDLTIQQRVSDPWGFGCDPKFSLSGSAAGDANIIEAYATEHLKAGASTANIFKLLGIHEQGITTDPLGAGYAISSGEVSSLPAMNVFEEDPCSGWKSPQKGNDVLTTAFIGYDFGPLRACDRLIYAVETKLSYMVTEIKIQQGPASNNRVTKARVERSDDGKTWYGVDILTLSDNDQLNAYNVRPSVKSRYWRLRPTAFNGGVKDSWHIIQIVLTNKETTRIDTIQDEMGFIESRDRDYAKESIELKMYYDLVDTKSDLSKLNIDISSYPYTFVVSFIDTVRTLGRPLVIGDIIELPNEIQYTPTLQPVKKFLEVTDISWDTTGYTPNWRPILQRVSAQPLIASQETLDVINGFHKAKDSNGFRDIDASQVQDMTEITHRIFETAEEQVPERGADTFHVAEIPPEVSTVAAKSNVRPKTLYVEDGLPPNGEKYTTGDNFPSNPNNGAYHRLTYTSLNNNIPPRLFKYSVVKNRWIYCETDRRSQYNRTKPSLQAHITSTTSKPNDNVTG